jgi:hypothetical protein
MGLRAAICIGLSFELSLVVLPHPDTLHAQSSGEGAAGSPPPAADVHDDELSASATLDFEEPARQSSNDNPPRDVDRTAYFEERLEQLLRRDATARSYLTPREPPRLRKLASGGYEWKGHAFTARIDPAGRVTFIDRPAFYYDGLATPQKVQTSPLTERASDPKSQFVKMVGGLLFRFDLTDLLQRAIHDDPYGVERDWFLEQTRALREELLAEHERCKARKFCPPHQP